MSIKGKTDWIKSSYSQGQGACLEVKVASNILTRDSKLDESPVVGFSASGFSALVEHARNAKL